MPSRKTPFDPVRELIARERPGARIVEPPDPADDAVAPVLFDAALPPLRELRRKAAAEGLVIDSLGLPMDSDDGLWGNSEELVKIEPKLESSRNSDLGPRPGRRTLIVAGSKIVGEQG